MYSRSDFVERFRQLDNETLFDRLAHEELTDDAKHALLDVLGERGIDRNAIQLAQVRAKKARHQRTGVTNHCDYCEGTLKRRPWVRNETGQRFCSPGCRESAYLLEVAEDIPAQQIANTTRAMWAGVCPRCRKQRSKVDVRAHYWAWSAIFITRFGHGSQVCCRHCGVKITLRSLATTLLFGWWGVPFGLLLTPQKIFQNLDELFRSDRQPSAALEKIAKLNLARQQLRASARPPMLETKNPP
jgi:hypothetical protein